jgi:DNA polymerase-3 subunit gamma/tau
MSYQVLARKFRPGDFSGLVGQDHVVRALTHALDHGRLHHAYLFTGTRGVGKTSIARVLAKCLNCEKGVSSTPCGECSICQEINENRFVDLIEVDAASRTRVDDTRELLENAQYLPTRGRYKIYLIDEVHMLSASSFNALLKTLEEPPEHVKFLLATTDPKKVPVTVLSRCLQFQLKNIASEQIAGYLGDILEQEGIPFEAEALDAIGQAARGSMRDAQSIADQAIGYGQGRLTLDAVVDMLGLVGRDEVGSLVGALADGDASKVLAVVAELQERAVDFEALLAELLSALHGMAVDHATGRGEGQPFDAETVQLLYQIALMGYRDLQIAPDPRSGLEMTLLRMLTFAPEEGGRAIPKLQARSDPAATTSRDSVAAPTEGAPTEGSAADPTVAEVAAIEAVAPEVVVTDTVATATVGSRPPPPGAAEGDQWHELVAALDLSGVARMIAEHSVLVELGDPNVRLLLDEAHDTLLNDAQQTVIERALTETLDRRVVLTIEPGVVEQETPAARRQRLADERQQDAQRLLESDRTVQSLLSEFDGRLDEVQPLDVRESPRGKAPSMPAAREHSRGASK